MAEFGAKLGLVLVGFKCKDMIDVSEKCYINNIINGTKFNYMKPEKVKDGYEVWFFADIEESYKHPDGVEIKTRKKLDEMQ